MRQGNIMYENKKHTNRNKMNSIGISADNLSVI